MLVRSVPWSLTSFCGRPKQKQKLLERVGKCGTASHRVQPVTAVGETWRVHAVLDAAMGTIFASLQPSWACSEWNASAGDLRFKVLQPFALCRGLQLSADSSESQSSLQCIVLHVSIRWSLPPLGSNLQRTQFRFEVDSLAGPCAHSDPVMSRQSGDFLTSHSATACPTVNAGDLKPSACRETGALKPGKTFLSL